MKQLMTAALIAGLVITSTASMAAADKPAKAVAVKFKAGASSATYHGKIKGYGYFQSAPIAQNLNVAQSLNGGFFYTGFFAKNW